ncbi:glycosyltransferase family 2 protein [Desulfofustis glycolicus]|uniref:Glycosyltransferase involved in cell wall bisynthesis n=1 Tax=Desulfofustis glycolicus DSM 9705 TaxID=1121409 RepID=A0A1M5UNH7_9BACT|nr:glycosyltransferase family 2 protein [Desulfofustis glycolicus]MCB2217391.1 glycosyltransferase family 2 protein [Desulfobulbaceae bacterium]SHH64491.1 Glycosyltransferase involved in cell wall bisynthesis [Desulfofustis glycolicus DSM 9705]
MKTALVIPVYNHGSMLAGVISQALELGLPLYVVDDGSTDQTAEILRSSTGITVLTHPVNRGKGAALLTGFAAAHGAGCDWAITLDADGQHLPADAHQLLAAVPDDVRCLVIGRRGGMDRGPTVPWTSRFGRGFSNFWVLACGGPAVSDSQSGFRLYPLPETLQLRTRARRYQFEVEVLVRAHQAGLAVYEAPVRVIYPAVGERVSHFRPFIDFLRNSETFSRLLLDRLVRGIFRP